MAIQSIQEYLVIDAAIQGRIDRMVNIMLTGGDDRDIETIKSEVEAEILRHSDGQKTLQ